MKLAKKGKFTLLMTTTADVGNDPMPDVPALDPRIFGSRKHTEPKRLLINRVRRKQYQMQPVQTTLVTNAASPTATDRTFMPADSVRRLG